MQRIISGETFSYMIKDVQNCQSEYEFKEFLKDLIDEIPLDMKEKELFIDDLKRCLDRTVEDNDKNFWEMDTALRDYFLNAILK